MPRIPHWLPHMIVAAFIIVGMAVVIANPDAEAMEHRIEGSEQ